LVDFYGRLIPILVFLVLPFSLITFLSVIPIIIPVTAFIIIVIGYVIFELSYGIIPIKFTNQKHFKKRGYESICVEFQTLKIIFVVVGSIELTIASLMNLGYSDVYISNLDTLFTYAFFGAGLRILTHFKHKEFRYYLAKGYCITATKKEDDFEKATYLSATLDSYNKYLRRRTQIEIKDVKRIYATFLPADMKEKNQIIKSVCESLEGDRLGLARYLSNVYKIPESEFFVEESIIQKLKPVGTFFAAAIPIIVSIIALLSRS
jgi:hypothetical protein